MDFGIYEYICRVKNLLIALTAATAPGVAAAGDRPNIILFMVDDMGWQDTSVPFDSLPTALNRKYHTPNMERLAAKGVKFTAAYASAISSPSRCSLMTGMNEARHRVTNWTLNCDAKVDEQDDRIAVPDWNVNGIQPTAGIAHSTHATSFVQLLQAAGYHTIHCGKAHFGAKSTPSADPLNYGFDVNIAGHAAGGPASYLGEKGFGYNPDGTPWHPNGFATPGLDKYHYTPTFLTEALTREALAALDTVPPSAPFFLYMAHYAVHVPLEADKRFIDKYSHLHPAEAKYATLVEGMDKSLGDIMDYLDAHNLANNTIILFMSDNGGLAYSGCGRGGGPNELNAPLRSGKGSAYEGGVRVPMIAYWPGVTQAAAECSNYVIIEDFFPTILDMAQVSCSASSLPQITDGVSFVPLLKGERSADTRPIYWNTPNIWISTAHDAYREEGIGATCAIRRGSFKLIYRYKDGSKELYNLARDIGETTDLSRSMPGKTAELSGLLGRYLRSVQAQRPTFKADGTPCPWPDEI